MEHENKIQKNFKLEIEFYPFGKIFLKSFWTQKLNSKKIFDHTKKFKKKLAKWQIVWPLLFSPLITRKTFLFLFQNNPRCIFLIHDSLSKIPIKNKTHTLLAEYCYDIHKFEYAMIVKMISVRERKCKYLHKPK